jgi:uncharacterized membrane protein YphA (DoxX/SURF4 family)
MITNIWPYILRLALGLYFIFNHLPVLLNGYKSIAAGNTIFACASGYIPPVALFTIWHGGFILLAALIILWPRPIAPLSISLFVLFCVTYINFTDIKNISSLTNLLTLICILINIALIIIYAKNRY